MASYELCMIASLMIGTLVQFLQSMGWHDKCYLLYPSHPIHPFIHSKAVGAYLREVWSGAGKWFRA